MRHESETRFDPGEERLGVERPGGGFSFIGVRTAGVYVPTGEPGHRGDRLTQLIRDAKATRSYDRLLARLLSRILGRTPTHVAAMPPRPGANDRLEQLRWLIARAVDARDTSCLSQRFDVPHYRCLTPEARRAIHGRFASEPLPGDAEVLLLDDVITSGGQFAGAATALLAAGARSVHAAAVARTVMRP